MIGGEGFERARLHAELSARMVEVGAKEVTDREAEAECVVTMTPGGVRPTRRRHAEGRSDRSRADRGTDGREANPRPPAVLSSDRA